MFWRFVVPLLAVGFAVASAGLVGAPADVDLNDEGVQNALRFAVAQHNRASNDMFINEVEEVVSVQRQVVSGLKYIFKVKMANTRCRKGSVETDCAIQEGANVKRYTCTFEVWSQPWTSTIKLTRNTCVH
ncbi:cystatin C (amyloid angiopathy and cerebral hemorrhage) [Chanos chanos]|uniref:Cystatin C (Amyloid angiopathy and cerebral hemorrhage) n=1 Tax=Chanos chanos TaxID=29144 RepID=A0A6J2V505_CHACN|nr:cystatin-like [Chanos chanos]